MKISIVTACLNSVKTIEKSILSVLEQTYKNIEYIIIDGGSTDGTISIIEKYRENIDVVISEKDDGLYDALNKGIILATGVYVNFLPSDDKYYNKEVIQTVVDNITQCTHMPDLVWGDIIFCNEQHEIVRYYRGNRKPVEGFRYGIMPPHCSLFVKKMFHDEYGCYDIEYKIAADYDLTLRYLLKYGGSYHYIPRVLVEMKPGGVSNSSFANIIRLNNEILKSHKRNGFPITWFHLLGKIPARLKEKFDRPPH